MQQGKSSTTNHIGGEQMRSVYSPQLRLELIQLKHRAPPSGHHLGCRRLRHPPSPGDVELPALILTRQLSPTSGRLTTRLRRGASVPPHLATGPSNRHPEGPELQPSPSRRRRIGARRRRIDFPEQMYGGVEMLEIFHI